MLNVWESTVNATNVSVILMHAERQHEKYVGIRIYLCLIRYSNIALRTVI